MYTYIRICIHMHSVDMHIYVYAHIFQAVRTSIYGRPGSCYIEVPGNLITDHVKTSKVRCRHFRHGACGWVLNINYVQYVIDISTFYIVHIQVHSKLTTLVHKLGNSRLTCIVPSCNAPSEKTSRLVDYLQSLPSYLKGTTDFL